MLGMKITPSATAWSADLDQVVAVVHFVGTWKGAVLLECTREEAFWITSRLMPVQRPTSVNNDVKDTLGELANMVAGNLKSVLKPGVDLSMPTVAEGTDYTLSICGGNKSRRMAFTGEAGTFSYSFWIALVETPERTSGDSIG